jgi:hypothetical protein
MYVHTCLSRHTAVDLIGRCLCSAAPVADGNLNKRVPHGLLVEADAMSVSCKLCNQHTFVSLSGILSEWKWSQGDTQKHQQSAACAAVLLQVSCHGSPPAAAGKCVHGSHTLFIHTSRCSMQDRHQHRLRRLRCLSKPPDKHVV